MLANGFIPCYRLLPTPSRLTLTSGSAMPRPGISIQRDLPVALQLTSTYLGVKGTRGVQQFLPNTYPIGAANPCPACPSGFLYRASGGGSTREPGISTAAQAAQWLHRDAALYVFEVDR